MGRICPVGQKQLNESPVAAGVEDGNPQRLIAMGIRYVNASLSIEENFCGPELALLHGEVQRGASTRVLEVDVSSCHCSPQCLDVALEGGVMQRRAPLAI